MFADVALPLPLRQTFSYRLPGDMGLLAGPGSRVIVPFGRKLQTGFIVAITETLEGEIGESAIKDVEELVDEVPVVPPDILELTRWMADYYYAPWGECLRAALPGGSMVLTEQVLELTDAGREALATGRSLTPSKRQAVEVLSQTPSATAQEFARLLSAAGGKAASAAGLIKRLEREGLIRVTEKVGESRLKPKLQNAVRLKSVSGDVAIEIRDSAPKNGDESASMRVSKKRKEPALTEQQLRVIDSLKSRSEPISLSDLLESANVSASSVRTLEKRGVVEVFAREVRRDPLRHLTSQAHKPEVNLSEEQQAALDQVLAKLEGGKYATLVLHGITGSGKTEIYIRAMNEALKHNRSALMLVPEISLTPVLSRRLGAHFGETLAILHSNLSDGERIDEWRRIRNGDARVVIGTRSAVFAPLKDLGIVIIDEEHDSSYKQDETPRYNGRDTAIMRALNANAVVVLGSATPSLESFHNSHSGRYLYVHLGARYANRSLAEVEAVDMREVFKRHGKQQTFSDELLAAIREAHARREQVMILLNRRGFSAFLLCRSCGVSVRCPNCDLSLTFHRYNLSLQCHYCNYICPTPKLCPNCNGQYIHYVGEGTEQLESKLHELFPTMRIARMDRDTTRRRGSFEHILMEFASGEIDLLVGTQMIAKGHDFPNVTLVGVVSVDAGLAMPDFRSAERTFQLLTQVAGRAGRGERPGKVVIQTYHPEHYAVVAARAQDYEAFYEREINFRRTMNYPPFSALINIVVHDKDQNKASALSLTLAHELRQAVTENTVRILGPAPAPFAKLRGEYRFQILIKARSRRGAREALDIAMARVSEKGQNLHSINVEVDPVSLM